MSDQNKTDVTVSVVIPVCNNQKTLPALLDSLRRQTIKPDEIIVVDDGSTDNSTAILTRYENCRLVRTGKNSGPSVARNRGAESATKDIILFLDSDVVVGNDAVAIIKEAFANRPDMVVMNGIMEKEPLNPGPFTRYKALCEYGWAQSIPLWDSSSKCFNARVGAIRCQALLSIGGFDPRYQHPSVEDHELGLRLIRHYPIYLNHKLTAFHHFPSFLKTCRNYYLRTSEFIKLMRLYSNQTLLDKGGASVKNTLEFLFGVLFLISLSMLAWRGWWLPITLFVLFVIVSFKSLRYHLIFGGIFFFLFSIGLHLIYGCVVVVSAIKTLMWLKACKNFGKIRYEELRIYKKSTD